MPGVGKEERGVGGWVREAKERPGKRPEFPGVTWGQLTYLCFFVQNDTPPSNTVLHFY